MQPPRMGRFRSGAVAGVGWVPDTTLCDGSGCRVAEIKQSTPVLGVENNTTAQKKSGVCKSLER